MAKSLFLAHIAFILILLIGCNKSNNLAEQEAINPENVASESVESRGLPGGNEGIGPCTVVDKCVQLIAQDQIVSSGWSLSVTVQKNSLIKPPCPETEIHCYRGSLGGPTCDNLDLGSAKFRVLPDCTYRFYYTGPVPRTFYIGNGCVTTSVTFITETPYIAQWSAFDFCNYSGPCN